MPDWHRGQCVQLQALGHDVRLMPPSYVKPYVKRQKNDATDAEAICEAVSRAIPVSARLLPPPLSPALPIRGHSDRGETSRPGLGWCRSRARAEASQGSGASANRAIAIYVACSQRVHSQSFAMPRSTVSDTDRGSPHC